MCIGDAIISLLHKRDFDTLKVSDICKRAGVSRMTFYHYYNTKTDVLIDYLDTIIREYLKSSGKQASSDAFHQYHHILDALKFFDQYADFFLTLSRAGLHSFILTTINEFMEEQILPFFSGSIYQLYFYAGALMNLFLKWEEKGKVESAEEIASILSRIPLS